MWATTPGDLHAEAAVALFDSMSVPAELALTPPFDVDACAIDREDLLVRVLSELLAAFELEGRFVTAARCIEAGIRTRSDWRVRLGCEGGRVDHDREPGLAAMAAAANFAFTNRQLVTDRVRRCLAEVFGAACPVSSVRVVYDVCHNIAKMETHLVDRRERRVRVHRKGATRAFPPGHPEVPAAYRAIGQPVLVPGDMERYSYVLVGTEQAMRESFGTCCHGAGRRLSRHAALRSARPRNIPKDLAEKGISVSGRRAAVTTVIVPVPGCEVSTTTVTAPRADDA